MPAVLWLLLLAPLATLLGLFALSNREAVALRLWPFDVTVVAPLALVVLGVAAVAFLFGALIAWAAGLGHRRRARRMEDAARLLEAELAQMRAGAGRTATSGRAPPPAAGMAAGMGQPARGAAPSLLLLPRGRA